MRGERVTLICKRCGVPFEKYVSELTRNRGQYCSWECYRTHHRTERICQQCGKEFTVKNAVVKKGHGLFCSRDCKHESMRTGEVQHRHGTKYNEWRQAVYARDNWTCQECGSKGYLNAHHVFPYADFPEHELAVWNGISLCIECHAQAHPDKALFIRSQLGRESN